MCYGVLTPGKGKDTVVGPMVLYRPGDNTLAWIDKSISRSDRVQMEFLRSVAVDKTSVPVTGDAVFQKLQKNVLEQAGSVLSA